MIGFIIWFVSGALLGWLTLMTWSPIVRRSDLPFIFVGVMAGPVMILPFLFSLIEKASSHPTEANKPIKWLSLKQRKPLPPGDVK